MTHRPGPRQREILRAMQQGARLYQESGLWYWEQDSDSQTHPASRLSCRGLLEHGLIYNDHTEEHPFWQGGVRWRYALTEQGKAALE